MLVLYLSLTPESADVPSRQTDKYEHTIAYGVLMFWFAHLEPDRGSRVRLAIGLACMGIAIECLQGLIGHRSFSVADIGANALGVALGWLGAPPRMPDVLAVLESRASRGGR